MPSRVFVIVLDGLGVGALPDAAAYGDEGANTLSHVLEREHPSLPVLTRLGLGRVPGVWGLPDEPAPQAAYGRAGLVSPGKDTISGHWELAGVVVKRPFRTFPHGFPDAWLDRFTAAIGRGVLGNVAASGTEIIERLGPDHLSSGRPIVYTSADSVLQIAAHEDVIPPAELYALAAVAREMLTGEYQVGRVIARPFAGRPGAFYRTRGRRDLALPPPGVTLLELVAEGMRVTAVGKVRDIFSGRGITDYVPAGDNREVMSELELLLAGAGHGLTFATLGDFDTRFGHRNDSAGFAGALEQFDRWLGPWLGRVRAGDVIVLTADHGCDPTWPGTDHTREYVPLLVAGPGVRAGAIGTRTSLADAGATVAEALGVTGLAHGDSFWRELG